MNYRQLRNAVQRLFRKLRC